MKKINWDLEEVVALYDLYFKSGRTLSIDKDKLKQLSEILNRRAKIKWWIVDEKFRDVTGLSMQLATIHYIVTGGKEGLKNSSKIFWEVYELYKEDPEKFDGIMKEFYLKYEWVWRSQIKITVKIVLVWYFERTVSRSFFIEMKG